MAAFGYNWRDNYWPIPDTKQNNMNLSITPEKVKEAADKCPQAKETLKTLFPEVFERGGLFVIKQNTLSADLSGNVVAIAWACAPSQDLEYKSLVLNPSYEWEFTKNGAGEHILIPRYK